MENEFVQILRHVKPELAVVYFKDNGWRQSEGYRNYTKEFARGEFYGSETIFVPEKTEVDKFSSVKYSSLSEMQKAIEKFCQLEKMTIMRVICEIEKLHIDEIVFRPRGMRILWSSIHGFGQYDLMEESYGDSSAERSETKNRLIGDSECMDSNEDKSFLKKLLYLMTENTKIR